MPKREFLHVDDLAGGIHTLMEKYDGDLPINIGVGKDVTILKLAEIIKETVGFGGELEWDSSQPDGTPRKLLDTSRINALGWKPRMTLREGIRNTYEWFKEHYQE